MGFQLPTFSGLVAGVQKEHSEHYISNDPIFAHGVHGQVSHDEMMEQPFEYIIWDELGFSYFLDPVINVYGIRHFP